jgi:hypothetical protein
MLVLFLLTNALANASDLNDPQIGWMNHFHMGVLCSYYKYTEPDLMKDSGWLKGVSAAYTSFNSIFYGEASLSVLTGKMHYDGATWGGDPLTADTRNTIIEGQGIFGRSYFNGLAVYSGIGRFALYFNTDYEYGYARRIFSWYLPIGFAIGLRENDWMTFRLEYDLFISGKVKAHMSDISSELNDIEFNRGFGDGHGIRGHIGYKRGSLTVKTYVNYWKFSDSDVEILEVWGLQPLSVYEPANTTKIIGIMVNYAF